MKKFLLGALCAASAVYASTFKTWNGADDDVYDQVQTGLNTEWGGFWFTYGDDGDGGASMVHWDMPLNPEYPYTLDPIIYECKGICGTAMLNKWNLTYTPFVGLAFSVVGQLSEKDWTLVTGDASSWGGLCVTYTSDTDIVKFDGETAAKQLATVKFKIQAEDGDYRFNICAVGPKDGTCPEQCGTPSSASIRVARGTSAVNAVLNSRMLGFTGISNAMNNAATLNLASLDAGIYMVRVSGKNINFAKKIVLR